MKVIGKVFKLEPVESGVSKADKAWQKQTLVIETGDEYNPYVAVSFFGEEKVGKLSALKPGQDVTVDVNLSSREHKGKWYSTIDGWKFETGTAQAQPVAAGSGNEEDDLPF